MENQNTNGIKAWQWVVTAVVIVALIVIGVIVFSNKGVEAPVVTAPEQTVSTSNTSNGLIMSDQYPGNVVYVSSVQLANPGWVIIQKSVGGKPEDVIGQTYLSAGIAPAKITLTQSTIDGYMYYAVLYSDNGDKKFDISTDKPITDKNGNIILKTFKATASAGAEIKG